MCPSFITEVLHLVSNVYTTVKISSTVKYVNDLYSLLKQVSYNTLHTKAMPIYIIDFICVELSCKLIGGG